MLLNIFCYVIFFQDSLINTNKKTVFNLYSKYKFCVKIYTTIQKFWGPFFFFVFFF